MVSRCWISRCVVEIIQRAAEAAAPREACGLLFGSEAEITGVQVTENLAENPESRFEIDPKALFAALKAERAGGPRLAGYFHSHPSGEASPSATDAAMAAADGKLWLIVAGEAMTLWRAGNDGLHGRFKECVMGIADSRN
jgi:proteasome lid subunit RPN8/RPN11